MTTHRELSWKEVHQLVEATRVQMQLKDFTPKKIIPIGGGGIIPASILAYRMYQLQNIPVDLRRPMYLKSYEEDNSQKEVRFVEKNAILRDSGFGSRGLLFVDEICDSGKTIRFLKDYFPNARFLTLISKNDLPDFYGTSDSSDQWWDFPWEK